MKGPALGLPSSRAVSLGYGQSGLGSGVSLAIRLQTLYSILGTRHISHPAGHPDTWGLDHPGSHSRETSTAFHIFLNDALLSQTDFHMGKKKYALWKEMTLYPPACLCEAVRTGKQSTRVADQMPCIDVALAIGLGGAGASPPEPPTSLSQGHPGGCRTCIFNFFN